MSPDLTDKLLDAGKTMVDGELKRMFEAEPTVPVSQATPLRGADGEGTSYPDEFADLEISEQEWTRLSQSQAGQLLKAAWLEARPLLIPIAQEGAGVLFGALASKIASK